MPIRLHTLGAVAAALAATAAILTPAPTTGASRAERPVVSVAPGGGLQLLHPDGRRSRVMPGLAALTPALSPDGRRIAFARRTGRTYDLWLVGSDGEGLRRVAGAADPQADELSPAWSPDGRLLAFTRRGAVAGAIHVVPAAGGTARPLTRGPRWVENTQPAFTPDGRHVVFASNRLGYWNIELFRARTSDGKGLTRLTRWGTGEDGAPGDDLMPDVSPDGRRIAFVSDRSGAYAVWVMGRDGSGLRKLAEHAERTTVFPRWSPDGTALVYGTVRRSDGGDPQLWRVGAGGGPPVALGRGGEPDW